MFHGSYHFKLRSFENLETINVQSIDCRVVEFYSVNYSLQGNSSDNKVLLILRYCNSIMLFILLSVVSFCRICYLSWMAAPKIIMPVCLVTEPEKLLRLHLRKFKVCEALLDLNYRLRRHVFENVNGCGT